MVKNAKKQNPLNSNTHLTHKIAILVVVDPSCSLSSLQLKASPANIHECGTTLFRCLKAQQNVAKLVVEVIPMKLTPKTTRLIPNEINLTATSTYSEASFDQSAVGFQAPQDRACQTQQHSLQPGSNFACACQHLCSNIPAYTPTINDKTNIQKYTVSVTVLLF